MKIFKWVFLAASLTWSFPAVAQNSGAAPAARHWADDSEAAVVIVGGNSQSETYSVKQKTSYTFDDNVFTVKADYLEGRSNGVEVAKNWDGTLRYDRDLSALWSIYAAHDLDSDVFAGYVQRTSYGAGAKYSILKTDDDTLNAELGYRYTFAQYVDPTRDGVNHFGRVFGKWVHIFNKGLSFEIWAEYLPNFTNPNGYLVNYEPSLNVILTQVLGLKVSYLVKYQGDPGPGLVNADTIYSTALTAKF